MNPRSLIVIAAALALGCGSAQHALAPEEALVDGFPAPHPAQQRAGKNGKCRDAGWPVTLIIRNGACWFLLDATPEQCAQAQREGGLEVLHQGQCWYPMPKAGERREPTSSIQRIKSDHER